MNKTVLLAFSLVSALGLNAVQASEIFSTDEVPVDRHAGYQQDLEAKFKVAKTSIIEENVNAIEVLETEVSRTVPHALTNLQLKELKTTGTTKYDGTAYTAFVDETQKEILATNLPYEGLFGSVSNIYMGDRTKFENELISVVEGLKFFRTYSYSNASLYQSVGCGKNVNFTIQIKASDAEQSRIVEQHKSIMDKSRSSWQTLFLAYDNGKRIIAEIISIENNQESPYDLETLKKQLESIYG